MRAEIFPVLIACSSERCLRHYDVLIDGDLILTGTPDLEADLTRVLLARGIKGTVELFDGRTGALHSRVNIKDARNGRQKPTAASLREAVI
jgi:hypothetical protein